MGVTVVGAGDTGNAEDDGGLDGAAPGEGELPAQPLTAANTAAAIDADVSPAFAVRLPSMVVASLAGGEIDLRIPPPKPHNSNVDPPDERE